MGLSNVTSFLAVGIMERSEEVDPKEVPAQRRRHRKRVMVVTGKCLEGSGDS